VKHGRGRRRILLPLSLPTAADPEDVLAIDEALAHFATDSARPVYGVR
jgi:hypothetical protein